MGTRDMFSTPPAITHSYWPDMTPIAAKLAACWPEPHMRSRVVPQTSSGKPAMSAAVLAMLTPCRPAWSAAPMTTSSTSLGSILTRSTSALSVSASRSSGRTPASLPFFLPTAVRTAPTITALCMAVSLGLRSAALDQVGELAEGADRSGGHLATGGALVQLHVLHPLESGPGAVEEAEEEVVLGPGRGLLQAVQHLLVGDRRGPLGERALLHDVVDPAQERVGCGLELGEAVERLHATHQLPVLRRQPRRLPRPGVGLPVHQPPQQGRRLVVQGVARGHHPGALPQP